MHRIAIAMRRLSRADARDEEGSRVSIAGDIAWILAVIAATDGAIDGARLTEILNAPHAIRD